MMLSTALAACCECWAVDFSMQDRFLEDKRATGELTTGLNAVSCAAGSCILRCVFDSGYHVFNIANSAMSSI